MTMKVHDEALAPLPGSWHPLFKTSKLNPAIKNILITARSLFLYPLNLPSLYQQNNVIVRANLWTCLGSTSSFTWTDRFLSFEIISFHLIQLTFLAIGNANWRATPLGIIHLNKKPSKKEQEMRRRYDWKGKGTNCGEASKVLLDMSVITWLSRKSINTCIYIGTHNCRNVLQVEYNR